jgi:hypothetical protein
MQSFMRGVLTAHHLNRARLVAVLVSQAVLIALLAIAVWFRSISVVSAAIAMTLCLVSDLLVLAYFWKKHAFMRTVPASAQSIVAGGNVASSEEGLLADGIAGRPE